MNKTILLRILVSFFIGSNALLPTFAADVPTGQFELIIDGSKLWDISGTYHEDFDGIDIDYTLVMDESGKIIGFGDASASLFGASLEADLNFNGSVKGLSVKLNFTMVGEVTDGGQTVGFNANVKTKLEIVESNRSVEGSTKGKIRVDGVGSQRIVGAFSFSLENDMDGSWILTLDLSDAGKNKITGSGTITLSNDKQFFTPVSGKYSSKKETAKLKLQNSTGTKFSLTSLVNGAMLEILKMKGKSLGQKP